MSKHNTGNLPELLYRIREGTVTAEIHGPRLGWRWRQVRYYRWHKANTGKCEWMQIAPERPIDQIYLERCAKAVQTWLKSEGETIEKIYKPPL